MMIVAYFFSYVPAIVYAVVGNKEKSQADSWFAFFAWYAVSFSSAVNPIIYYLRTSRYRSAFSQFIKDPFGSSDFKEKPSCRVKGEKKLILKGAGTTRKKGEEKLGGSVVQEKYHGERRNGILALSIEAQDARLCVFAAGLSIVDERAKLNKGEAFCSMSSALPCPNSSNPLPQPQLLIDERGDGREQTIKRTIVKKEKKCGGTEAASEDRNIKQSRNKGLEDGFRKGKNPFSSSKIHPLGITDSEEIGHCAEEEEEIHAYRTQEETNTTRITF